MDKAFPVGTSVFAKVKQIEKSGTSLQLKLTCRINEEEVKFFSLFGGLNKFS